MGWRIELFGGPRVVAPDGRITERFPTQKTAALLAYLALHPSRPHSRELLAERFWPDRDPARSRNSLSSVLSALRGPLGEALVTDKLRVGLDPARIATDVAEFEAALHAGDLAGAGKRLGAELLPGVYDDWAILERERLEALWEDAVAAAGRQAPGRPGRLHRFPVIENGFVGRAAERTEILERLRGDGRLLTLAGTGGVGKTRLAHQCARECRAAFPGGVFWVALDDVRTGDALLRQVAAVLRTELEPRVSPTAQIGRALGIRGRTLVVLDNVEQIPDAATAVRALLADAPECRLLATSRRRLGLRAEAVLELSPLPLADAEALFRQRVEAVRLGEPLPENDGAVTALCRRLDGLPLALELAAARIGTLTPSQMLDRLETRFRLLQARTADLPERQRTLRATIAWSHDALPPDERRLFAQLSVFVGAFTLDDAETVCDAADVFEGVCALRDSSLVAAERATGRLYLLESLRDFAADHLAQDADARQAVRARHAAHFLRLADDALARLRTRDEAEALRRLDALAPNLSAALETAPAEMVPPLALAIARPLQRRGFFAEAAALVDRGLDAGRLPALVWERAGLHFDQGERDDAEALAEEARARFAETGDTRGTGQAENLLGQVAYKRGRWDDARMWFARALRTLDPRQAALERAIVGNNVALVELEAPDGDRERAVALLTEARDVRRAHGDLRGVAAAVANLGNLAFAQDDFAAARRHFAEALAVETPLGNVFGIARALNNLGETLERLGDDAQALRLYAGAHHLFAELGHDYAAYTESLLQALARRTGTTREEIDGLRAALVGHSAEEIAAAVWGKNLERR